MSYLSSIFMKWKTDPAWLITIQLIFFPSRGQGQIIKWSKCLRRLFSIFCVLPAYNFQDLLIFTIYRLRKIKVMRFFFSMFNLNFEFYKNLCLKVYRGFYMRYHGRYNANIYWAIFYLFLVKIFMKFTS